MAESHATILCVDDDRDLAEVVQAVLADEGYGVSCLYTLDEEALMRTVGRLEPDCVLLDSGDAMDYGISWELAGTLRERHRSVPVVMFSAHRHGIEEAQERVTERAKRADFAAVLSKPFHLDDMVACVATAVGRSVPFDRSEEAEAERTRALVRALATRGATDIQPSKLREWAMFRDTQGALLQVYWWQGRGVYQIGRYDEDGRMQMLGQFTDRDLAIEVALPS